MNKLEMIINELENTKKEILEQAELRSQMAKLYGDFDTQAKIHENNIINLNNKMSELTMEYCKALAEQNK